MMKFTGVEVFVATMARERETLGDEITQWMRENPSCEVVEVRTMQSSDSNFHCITAMLFYVGKAMPRKRQSRERDAR